MPTRNNAVPPNRETHSQKEKAETEWTLNCCVRAVQRVDPSRKWYQMP